MHSRRFHAPAARSYLKVAFIMALQLLALVLSLFLAGSFLLLLSVMIFTLILPAMRKKKPAAHSPAATIADRRWRGSQLKKYIRQHGIISE